MTVKEKLELINNYYALEFEDEKPTVPDDLTNIGLASTTLTEEEIPIQVSIDINKNILKTYIGSDYPTEKDLVEQFEVDDVFYKYLDFDSLIEGWTSYIEENILNKGDE